MRKVITITIILFCISIHAAKKVSKYTAEYYTTYIDKYVDTEVTIEISYFYVSTSSSTSSSSKMKGYRRAQANTYYRGDNGSHIYVYLPKEDFTTYMERYGTSYRYTGRRRRTKSLKGILKQEGGSIYLVVLKDEEKSKKEEVEKKKVHKPASDIELNSLKKIYKNLPIEKRKKIVKFIKSLK